MLLFSVEDMPGIKAMNDQESISGIYTRNLYQESISGVYIRSLYQESISGIYIRNLYQGLLVSTPSRKGMTHYHLHVNACHLHVHVHVCHLHVLS